MLLKSTFVPHYCDFVCWFLVEMTPNHGELLTERIGHMIKVYRFERFFSIFFFSLSFCFDQVRLKEMSTLPFIKADIVPINCVPICPSSSQVLSVEKKRHSIQHKGAKNCSVRAEALISEFDKFAFGEMSTSNIHLSPEQECLCGKMYFTMELLRQIEKQTLVSYILHDD